MKEDNSNKYKGVKVNGKRYDEHRHIMQQHLGRKLDRYEVVHHINGNKSDNRLENLEVMSLSEHSRMHMKDKIIDPDKVLRGDQVGTSVLTEKEVVEIKEKLGLGLSQQQIADEYGVGRATIGDIKIGRSWRHI